MLFWPKGFNELDKQTKETTDILCYYCNIVFAQFPNSFYTFGMEKTDEFLRNSFVTLTF